MDYSKILNDQPNVPDKLANDYRKTYVDLQLDPEDVDQWTAFETLCWYHIRRHASVEWIQRVQDRTTPLTWTVREEDRSVEDPKKRRMKTFTNNDETLDHITHLFVEDYGKEIWPRIGIRSHLTEPPPNSLNAVILKAQPQQTVARADLLTRLAKQRGVSETDRIAVVESKIGKRVRKYFKGLLLTRFMPLRIEDDPSFLLLLIRKAVTPEWSHCPRLGCSVVRATRTAMAVHRDHEYHAPGSEIVAVDLTVDDE